MSFNNIENFATKEELEKYFKEKYDDYSSNMSLKELAERVQEVYGENTLAFTLAKRLLETD